MQGETKECWERLCAQAAVEQDSDKLLKLVEEINQLLMEKEQRHMRQGSTTACKA